MRMRTWRRFLVFTLVVLLSGGGVNAQPPQPEDAPAPASTPLETLLNPDGTLRLDGSFSGALDVSGWQVALDPEEGPIFQPQGGPSQWTNLGSAPGGALNGQVNALAVIGSDLYVGGQFTDAGGIPEADYLARWNGTGWSALGGGGGTGALNGYVNALAVMGSDLYVGGSFTNAAGVPEADRVARWNGSAWSALGGSGDGVLTNTVYALAVSGSDLYVGGAFQNAAGIPQADRVARWNGASWSALGGSGDGVLTNNVYALAVSGSDLYVGGAFQNAAGIPQGDYVARWNGASWSALFSSGSDGQLNGTVYALAYGSGGLYAGGAFTNAAGIPQADYVARWDGSAWNALGGISGNGALDNNVYALAVSGSNVYVGGAFTNAAGVAEADYLARWNGASWSALGGSGNGALGATVVSVAVSGGDLYAGGAFQNAGGILQADNVARWSGSAWSNLGGIPNDGPLAGLAVYALAVRGGDLFVGGDFTDAGGVPEADYLARWNGTGWSALGGGGGASALNRQVNALAVRGGDLYVGGDFTNASGVAEADYLARWDGTAWSALGGSGGTGALDGPVHALAVLGGDVYAGGNFTNAAGIAQADYVARWNGSAWNNLGGSGGAGALNNGVNALAVLGNSLLVGGGFADAAGIAEADYVARWDGTAWSALGGSGGAGALNNDVYALAVSDRNVYVGGGFLDAAGIAEADYVARWDGTAWSALGGSGGTGALDGSVLALAVLGGNVYVGGGFLDAAGIAEADYVARWDGSAWSNLGGSGGNGALNDTVYALAISGNDLFVGGRFQNAAGNLAFDRIAAYAAPPSVIAVIRLGPNPTGAASVQFRVAFDEPVLGVTADDFVLATTGSLSGASISGVSGSGGATYVVTVATGPGNGDLRLDVPAGATIRDLVGLSPNNLPFTTGETYSVSRGVYLPLVRR